MYVSSLNFRAEGDKKQDGDLKLENFYAIIVESMYAYWTSDFKRHFSMNEYRATNVKLSIQVRKYNAGSLQDSRFELLRPTFVLSVSLSPPLSGHSPTHPGLWTGTDTTIIELWTCSTPQRASPYRQWEVNRTAEEICKQSDSSLMVYPLCSPTQPNRLFFFLLFEETILLSYRLPPIIKLIHLWGVGNWMISHGETISRKDRRHSRRWLSSDPRVFPAPNAASWFEESANTWIVGCQ